MLQIGGGGTLGEHEPHVFLPPPLFFCFRGEFSASVEVFRDGHWFSEVANTLLSQCASGKY